MPIIEASIQHIGCVCVKKGLKEYPISLNFAVQMKESKKISGFSKMSKTDKISWIAKNFLYKNPIEVAKDFADYWHESVEEQKIFDGFSENTLTNFYMPFGVAPNFNINGRDYIVPMVIEESSVVAAASNAAKFWYDKGGIKTTVLSTKKLGHVHFLYKGNKEKFFNYFPTLKANLLEGVKPITKNMEARGGGVLDVELVDFSDKEDFYYQLKVTFETCDSMGANFINSVLEEFSKLLVQEVNENGVIFNDTEIVEVVMSILSNYTPECVVKAEVSCPVADLGNVGGLNAQDFARRFSLGVRMAQIDPYRATTHNKGIQNGIDAVVIATGNDFRAVESCIHTYACRNGQYESLSEAEVKDGIFRFTLTVPLALGTVGGLTSLHPMAKKSLEILGNPTAEELMQITAAVGLAQNFAAVKSLVTTGIQQGHMKMHLNNIIASLQATEEEAAKIKAYFVDKVVSFSSVREFLTGLREGLGYERA